jgi:hypothetical protein
MSDEARRATAMQLQTEQLNFHKLSNYWFEGALVKFWRLVFPRVRGTAVTRSLQTKRAHALISTSNTRCSGCAQFIAMYFGWQEGSVHASARRAIKSCASNPMWVVPFR